MNAIGDFDGLFSALCGGHAPFRWQRRLFAEFIAGRVPQVCSLPTGLGKTSIIPIWLIALAHSALANGGLHSLPRRLVYIVNRRTVVDQATETVENIRAALNDASRCDSPAGCLREALGRLCAAQQEEVLAISTLRGEFADNGEWKTDPARPAIVIGTVDMIGSKLLFSGYGDSRYRRPQHAGLIGQDALLVLDESHLSPALGALLRTVEAEQTRCGDIRPIRVMEMSATLRQRAPSGREARVFTLTGDDLEDDVVARRLNAIKRLTLQSVDAQTRKKADVIEALVEAAVVHDGSGAAVVIYVRSPDVANQLAAALRKKLADRSGARVKLLTGTVRGYERAQLAETELFKQFRALEVRRQRANSLYLVCTSAGEVGVDLDADHMVCDLSPLESMVQRLGRVNRLGGDGRASQITVVCQPTEKGDPLEANISRTAELLQTLPRATNPALAGALDASPAALLQLLSTAATEDAFSTPPTIACATDILFDNWSLTSVASSLPGRPTVAPYLHGAEYEPPETCVVWRADLLHLWDAHEQGNLQHRTLEAILDKYPVKSWEYLKDTTTSKKRSGIQAQLLELALRERAHGGGKMLVGDMPAIVMDSQGTITFGTVRQAAESSLESCTVILPIEAGGLSEEGTFDPQTQDPDRHAAARTAPDVADERLASIVRCATDADRAPTRDHRTRLSASRLRVLLYRDQNGWMAEYVGPPHSAVTPALPTEPAHDYDDLIDQVEAALGMRVTAEVPIDAAESEEPRRILLYLLSPKNADAPPDFTGPRQTLDEHTQAVTAATQRIADRLALDPEIKRALTVAARLHDAGKHRSMWQRMIGGTLENPFAKSGKRHVQGRLLDGYRHEFGSLHDAAADSEIQQLEDDTRELALHLIASHHEYARPHFERKAFGNEGPPGPNGITRPPTTTQNEATAVEVIQRFARLQRRCGRWGLAWLESLLRCADALGSRSGASARSNQVRIRRSTLDVAGSCQPPALMKTATIISIPVDVANPGQFFACCGLLELAHRLWPSVEGWFGSAPSLFSISTTEDSASLGVLLSAFKACVLTEGGALMRTDIQEPSTDESDEKAEPLLLGEPFSLLLDWFVPKLGRHLKPWAGTMNGRLILLAMKGAIDETSPDPFAQVGVVFDTEAHAAIQRPQTTEREVKRKKREPFYFDARRGAHATARDIGFMPDSLKIRSAAFPAVEALCLIGLQRFRPTPTDASRVFDYFTWPVALSAPLAAIAMCGKLPGMEAARYRFQNAFRTDQRKHKAFTPATKMEKHDD